MLKRKLIDLLELLDSRLTSVVVPAQVVLVDDQVVVLVQFPKLAVDDVKVFIRKVVRDLVDVLLRLQHSDDLQKVGLAQFRDGDSATPRSIDTVEDAGDHL